MRRIAFWRISGPLYVPSVTQLRQIRKEIERIKCNPDLRQLYDGSASDGAPALPEESKLAILVAVVMSMFNRFQLERVNQLLGDAGFASESLPTQEQIRHRLDNAQQRQQIRQELGYWMYCCLDNGDGLVSLREIEV